MAEVPGVTRDLRPAKIAGSNAFVSKGNCEALH